MNKCVSIDYANAITVSPQTYGYTINRQRSKIYKLKRKQRINLAVFVNLIISFIWALSLTPIIKVETHFSSSSCHTMINVLHNVFCALSSGSIPVTKSAVLQQARGLCNNEKIHFTKMEGALHAWVDNSSSNLPRPLRAAPCMSGGQRKCIYWSFVVQILQAATKCSNSHARPVFSCHRC